MHGRMHAPCMYKYIHYWSVIPPPILNGFLLNILLVWIHRDVTYQREVIEYESILQFETNTRIFFNKGHLIRDSTEKIRQNKGHSTLPSTELYQNKGQGEFLLCL